MRIWHQSVIALTPESRYAEVLREHARKVGRPGTEVEVHGFDPEGYRGAPSPVELVRHAYLMSLHQHQILENVLRAEREGYDAVAINVIQAPGVREARGIVDIPVVSYGEAAMHFATMLGDRFGIVAFNEDLFPLFRQNIHEAGLESKAGPIVGLETRYTDVVRALDEPGGLLEEFRLAARKALEAGADSIIPGQALLGEVLFRHGLTRVDEAPVIHPLGAAIKMAEALVDLRQLSGVYVNRRRSYFWSRPPAELIAEARRYAGQLLSKELPQ